MRRSARLVSRHNVTTVLVPGCCRRHPSIWYNPKLLGPRSKLLERAFRLLRKTAARQSTLHKIDDGFVDSDVEDSGKSDVSAAIALSRYPSGGHSCVVPCLCPCLCLWLRKRRE